MQGELDFSSGQKSLLAEAIDRAGGGNTDEQPHRELGSRKTIRVACE